MIEYAGLLDTGMLGIVVGWFMFRHEKVVNNNTKVLYEIKGAINKCERANNGK